MVTPLPALAGLSGWIDPRRQALLGLASGLVSGNNLSEGLGMGFQMAAQGKQADDAYATAKKDEQKRADQLNYTIQAFQKAGRQDLVDMANAGMMGEAWNEFQKPAPEPKGPIKASAGDVFLDPETYQPISSIPDPSKEFANEKDLFAQYSAADPVKTYGTVRDAYERVRQSAALDTGAGDMGLIYGYMKMLDPGSVVRESEFAMAAQTGSYGEQIQGLVQRVLTGERLTPSQRRAFEEAAAKLYEESAGNLSEINSQFSGRAQRYGVNPGFIRQPEAYKPLNNIADPLGIR
jgi:hypothetical protein